MNRPSLFVLAASLAGLFALQAQTAAPNPLIAESKRNYTQIKNNIVRGAEKMPEDLYAYQPVPEIRTFAALMGHIADATLGLCSSVHGDRKRGDAGSKTAKAELVAALNAAFADCDAAWDTITDANAMEMVGQASPNQRTKLGTLIYAGLHADEEYGYMAVYMRMKSVVPPSSDSAGRGGKKQ